MDKAKRILIIDDILTSRSELLMRLDELGFVCEGVSNGFEGIVAAKESAPDLVIMDVSIPVMDGFEVCRVLKAAPETKFIPVLLVGPADDREAMIRSLESGAEDFICRPAEIYELQLRIRNLLKARKHSEFLQHYNRLLEAQITRNSVQLKSTLIESINRLALAAEFRDGCTGSHIERMSMYTMHMADTLGMSKEAAETMYYASPMHDIGKIAISDAILMKPGPLSAFETEVMRKHPTIGGQLLEGSDSPIIKAARNFALTHHERWDGTGYPEGLRHEEIPFEGRILNIVDQYDALRSERPYKQGISHAEAVHIILNGDSRTSPGHFDPLMLEAFADTADEFDRIYTNSCAGSCPNAPGRCRT